jgi:hypothetical protein
MRTTLITGLMLCMPTAVLLASVSLAVLASKLRRTFNRRFAGPPVAEPDREEFGDGATSLSTASAGRLAVYPPDGPCGRGPCCQTPIALPAGSRVIATHRSPSGYGLVVTSPPASVTRARTSSMSCT